jgi:hypothetical protein
MVVRNSNPSTRRPPVGGFLIDRAVLRHSFRSNFRSRSKARVRGFSLLASRRFGFQPCFDLVSKPSNAIFAYAQSCWKLARCFKSAQVGVRKRNDLFTFLSVQKFQSSVDLVVHGASPCVLVPHERLQASGCDNRGAFVKNC